MMSRRVRGVRKGRPPPTDAATGVELDANKKVFLCALNPCFGNDATRLECYRIITHIVDDEIYYLLWDGGARHLGARKRRISMNLDFLNAVSPH